MVGVGFFAVGEQNTDRQARAETSRMLECDNGIELESSLQIHV